MVSPTCNANGYTEHVCENCGKTYRDEAVSATGIHNYSTLYIMESTCVSRKVLKVCTVCNTLAVVDEVPVANHEYVDKVCIICGKELPKWEGDIAIEFAGGSGTEEDPYLISTGAQLALLASVLNEPMVTDTFTTNYNKFYDKCYKLTNDINLGGLEWEPISVHISHTVGFRGIFDGNGYSITDYKITYLKYAGHIGLFGNTYKAKIINLNIDNVEIIVTSTADTEICAGGIVGVAFDTYFNNCTFSGKIYVTATAEVQVGGIAGQTYEGNCVNCSANCDIKSISTDGYGHAGGIVGYGGGSFSRCSSDGIIMASSNCENSVTTHSGAHAGGIIGYVWDATISASTSSATILAESHNIAGAFAGGIAARVMGSTSTSCSINNCYTTGNVSAQSYMAEYIPNNKYNFTEGSIAGGIMGLTNSLSDISNSYATGNITALSISTYGSAGGIVGLKNSAPVTNCFATGDIFGSSVSQTYDYITESIVSGIAGYTYFDEQTLINSYQYEGQVIIRNNEVVTSTDFDVCTLSQLNSSTFYVDILGWDASVWDITNLDFENGKTPLLN